jgi:Uncharacterized protein containing caspase domain
MKHLKKRLFCCVLALLAAVAFSQEAKNALLIANGDYAKGIEPLTNPQPEAQALKKALVSIGFDVTLVENADLKTMRKELKAFKKKNEEARGIAFFHYGGHAIQASGINYLIPIEAEIEDDDDESDAQYKFLNVDQIMDSMTGKTNIVILDSCRNNPFKQGKTRGSSGTRGLVGVSTANHINDKDVSVTVYSAAPGHVAQDGLFTPILTQKITEKDKNLNKILTEIGDEMSAKTKGGQRPGVYSNQGGVPEIYLAGRSSSVTAGKGFIQIKSGVAGVVLIDGENKGEIKKDGIVKIELQNGTYSIEIRSEFASVKRKATVDAGETTSVQIETGNILITSEITGELYVNDKKCGEIKEKSPLSISNLPTGTKYNIEVRTTSEVFKQEIPLMMGQDNASVFIEKHKKEKPMTMQSKESKRSAQHISAKTTPPKYSFGVYGGYSLSHFAAAPFSFTGHGMSFGILPLQKTFGIFDLKTAIGYAFAYKSIKNDTLIYHELDVISVKAGLKFAGVSFHIGLGVPVIWEVVKHKSAGSGTLTRFAISTPIDIQYAFNNYIALYAEYAPAFPVGNRGIPLVKHSFNIGVAANIFHLY